MKHIAKYQNATAMTEAVKERQLSNTYVVKTMNDDQIRFGTDSGLYLIVPGDVEKHYFTPMHSPSGIGVAWFEGLDVGYYPEDAVTEFQIFKDGQRLTAETFYHHGEGYATCGNLEARECGGWYDPETGEWECEYPELEFGVSAFTTNLPVREVRVEMYPAAGDPIHGLTVIAETGYGDMTGSCGEDHECECNCQGGSWNEETQECEFPEPEEPEE